MTWNYIGNRFLEAWFIVAEESYAKKKKNRKFRWITITAKIKSCLVKN